MVAVKIKEHPFIRHPFAVNSDFSILTSNKLKRENWVWIFRSLKKKSIKIKFLSFFSKLKCILATKNEKLAHFPLLQNRFSQKGTILACYVIISLHTNDKYELV